VCPKTIAWLGESLAVVLHLERTAILKGMQQTRSLIIIIIIIIITKFV